CRRRTPAHARVPRRTAAASLKPADRSHACGHCVRVPRRTAAASLKPGLAQAEAKATKCVPRRTAAASLKHTIAAGAIVGFSLCSAANSRGLIEALSWRALARWWWSVPRRTAAASLKLRTQPSPRASCFGVPRRTAAASLKLAEHRETLIVVSPCSAANSRGLIEADRDWQRITGSPVCSAANSRGLIE